MKTRSPLTFFPRLLPCPTAPRCDGTPSRRPEGTEVTLDLILSNGRLMVRNVGAPEWAFCGKTDLRGWPQDANGRLAKDLNSTEMFISK